MFFEIDVKKFVVIKLLYLYLRLLLYILIVFIDIFF